MRRGAEVTWLRHAKRYWFVYFDTDGTPQVRMASSLGFCFNFLGFRGLVLCLGVKLLAQLFTYYVTSFRSVVVVEPNPHSLPRALLAFLTAFIFVFAFSLSAFIDHSIPPTKVHWVLARKFEEYSGTVSCNPT
jgi:hypothetical protein